MGFVQWLCWARSCACIGLWVAIGPSYLVGSCCRCIGIVLAIGLIVRIVHLSGGGKMC
jgi:hypothetical protein